MFVVGNPGEEGGRNGRNSGERVENSCSRRGLVSEMSARGQYEPSGFPANFNENGKNDTTAAEGKMRAVRHQAAPVPVIASGPAAFPQGGSVV